MGVCEPVGDAVAVETLDAVAVPLSGRRAQSGLVTWKIFTTSRRTHAQRPTVMRRSGCTVSARWRGWKGS
jgi:hypothetical protein